MHRRRNIAVSTVAALALCGSALVAQAGTPDGETITAEGVGDVKLGTKHSKLKEKGLVGKLKPGCELAPGSRAAKLKGALEGVVNFTVEDPPRAESVLINGGGAETEEGVTVGSRRREVKDAYPNAKFDHDTDEVFLFTLVTIPKRDGGKFQFAIDVATKRVTLIGVPFIAVCE